VLVPELAWQRPSWLASLVWLDESSTLFTRGGAPHQFRKMLRRLDRERLDCIVLKTHTRASQQAAVPLE